MREDRREGEGTHSPLNFTLFILHLHKFLTMINVQKRIDRHSGVGANSIATNGLDVFGGKFFLDLEYFEIRNENNFGMHAFRNLFSLF